MYIYSALFIQLQSHISITAGLQHSLPATSASITTTCKEKDSSKDASTPSPDIARDKSLKTPPSPHLAQKQSLNSNMDEPNSPFDGNANADSAQLAAPLEQSSPAPSKQHTPISTNEGEISAPNKNKSINTLLLDSSSRTIEVNLRGVNKFKDHLKPDVRGREVYLNYWEGKSDNNISELDNAADPLDIPTKKEEQIDTDFGNFDLSARFSKFFCLACKF